MSGDDLEILRRAHALFAAASALVPAVPDPGSAPTPAGSPSGRMAAALRAAATDLLEDVRRTRHTDARLAEVLGAAAGDHAEARRRTGAVLAAARTDARTMPDNPLAARELMRRRLIRLRNQHAHVRAAHARSRRHRSALRDLHYRSLHYRTHPIHGRDRRAVLAVRSALSRLGTPYVWGATGPDRFDCSGLVQWSYAQAGIRLRRTTYEQIHQGVAVAPAQVRPGDLVFPHAGHVQLAIGGGLVVEAPEPGSVVQISRMGPSVAIRRLV